MADGKVTIEVDVNDGSAKNKLNSIGNAAKASAKPIDGMGHSAKSASKDVDGLGDKSKKTKKDVEGLSDSSKDTEKGVSGLGDKSEKTSTEIDGMGDSAEGTEKSIGVLGVTIGNLAAQGMSALISKLGECVGSLFSLAEETVEYREDMAKLDAAFTTAGHSSETASAAYKSFYGILGESDRSVEAVNHLAELTKNEEEVAKWSTIAAGVTAKFGDSLPIEGLTEAANETAKVGQVTGPLADALNWAGISEDEFNQKLAACNSEQERATLITETLATKYQDAADAYNKATADIQALRQAESELTDAQAQMGASMTPLVTLYKSGLAGVLSSLAPQMSEVSDGLMGMFNGVEGSSEKVVSGISGMINSVMSTITSALPTLIPLGVEMVSSLISGLVSALPALLDGAVLLISEVAAALPDIMQTLVTALPSMIESLMSALPELIPQVVTGIAEAVTMLANNIGNIIQPLIDGLPDIVISLIDALMTNLPLVIEGTISLVMAIVEAIPQIIEGIVDALPTIISLVISGLLKCLPQIIAGLIQVVWGIVKSLPSIFVSLIEGIVNTFVGIWLAIKDVFAPLGEWFGEKFGDAWEAIKNAWSKVVDWFSDIWDGICNVFASIGNWFRNKFNEAKTSVTEAFAPIVAWFSGIWSSITGVFAAVGSWFSTKFNEAVSGIKNAWASIKSFFTEKWNQITGVFNNAKAKFLSIGKNIVDGIKQGIKNAWSNLKSWFEGLFGDLKDVAKRILGIKSPSREFAYIGRMIVEGLEKGIKDTRLRAISAVEKLGIDAITVMSKNAKEQVKAYTKKYDDLVKAQKAGNKKITDEQIKAAEEDKKFWEDRDKALDSVAEKMEDHFDDLRQIEKDYASDVKSINAKLREDINKEWDKYNDAFNSRVSSIKNELGLFDMAEKGDAVKTSDMFDAVKSQIDVLDDYNAALDTLMGKSVTPAFIQEMTEMGIDALPYLEALNKMTDEELSEYVTLWEQKNGLAAAAALDELSYLKDETHENIKGLEAQAETDLADLRTTYRNNLIAIAEDIGETLKGATNSGLEELGKDILGYTDTAKLQMERLGEAMYDGLIEGMESREGQVIDLLMNNIGSGVEKFIIDSSENMAGEGTPLKSGMLTGYGEKMSAIKQIIEADTQGALAAVKAIIGIENTRYSFNSGVADTGMADLTRIVGMQTAGINSLAGQFIRSTPNMRPVIIQVDGRELGRTVVDLGNAETNRVGKFTLGGAY